MTDALKVALLELETAVRAYEAVNQESRDALALPQPERDRALQGFDTRIFGTYEVVQAVLKRIDELRDAGQA